MRIGFAILAVGLASCGATDVTHEFKLVKDGVDATTTDIEKRLGPFVKDEERQARIEAIAAGARWQLTSECRRVRRFDETAQAVHCRIRQIGGTDTAIGPAKSAVNRTAPEISAPTQASVTTP